MTAPLVIVGGGLSGCLAALALVERRPDAPLLLIEQGDRFGGNHVWSFFDTDVAAQDRWLIEPLVSARWAAHDVRFPRRARTIALGYNSIRSERLDAAVRQRLKPGQYRLGCAVAAVEADNVVIDGQRIHASAVIDARGPTRMAGLDLAWQKFVGRTYCFIGPHGSERPVVMDARVAQDTGYRFVYTLPFSADELLIEDTYYSASPVLDAPLVRGRIESYARERGWTPDLVVAEEQGVLPVLLGGSAEQLWPADRPPIARLGLSGGFFHPTTGYSLPDAVRNAVLLAGQRDLSGPALHDLLRRRALRLWSERSFYPLLNRMLFRAAEPSQRYRILEHFYRLPESVIARFYAGQLTSIDKLRILSGRPPVPIGSAVRAMRRQFA